MKPSPDSTPPTPHQTRSVFAGKGLFTAWNSTAAFDREADWIAYQIDPEGAGPRIIDNGRGRFWMARPTQDGVQAAANAGDTGVPFIAQAESQAELDVALALDTTKLTHKALIGNPSAWTGAGFATAAWQGWELILEWYWNAQPSYTAPDAHNYPRLASVCFGCYDASGEQPDGRRVGLADYRNVWRGDYSVYLAETMTAEDWNTFSEPL